MCCKLPEIPSINKKSFSWCSNCKVGQGCKIYDKRPKKCKDFYCAYALGFTNLKPNKYGFFIFHIEFILTTYEIILFTLKPFTFE